MAENLIRNGDFEDGKTSWNFTSGQTSIIGEEDTVIPIKNKFCRISATESVYQQPFIQAGKTYLVNFRHRNAAEGTISIQTNNSHDTHWQEPIRLAPAAWTSALEGFHVEDKWGGNLVLHFHANAGSYVDIDDVEVYEVTLHGGKVSLTRIHKK